MSKKNRPRMRAIFASGLIFAVHAVSGFETENFDFFEIISQFVQTLEHGEKRVKRAFGGGHGKIITGMALPVVRKSGNNLIGKNPSRFPVLGWR